MSDPIFEAHTAARIRAAEAPLLDAQDSHDELMKSAAHAVFLAAESMLGAPGSVLILAGKGGNGGDALYAGAELAMAGHRVDAWCVFGGAHSPALEVFRTAGGTVLDAAPEDAGAWDLTIDGILGLGGAGGLPAELGRVCGTARTVLAVDVPSGVDADTGEAGDVHVTADATVTFGGWRLAHALAPECGTQLLAEIGLGGRTLDAELSRTEPAAHVSRASGFSGVDWPPELRWLEPLRSGSLEPGARDDKYTGGVVGIRAGSDMYPGAPILCTAGAVTATPAMVRYTGPQAVEVVRAHPEVIAAEALEETGRVQAWVFGPGAGTDGAAAGELAWLLAREEPLLVDADGLTLLAEHEDLRDALRERTAFTVLTPHDGEAGRLRKAVGVEESDRLTEARKLADQLQCTILRKGRASIVAPPNGGIPWIVDAGNSWAATPGSGDVLAGIAGARLARVADGLDGETAAREIARAVTVHALAAKLAAGTRFGEAATSASDIAAHVREASAWLTAGVTERA
ncbi:bifunctional ADP-dependent NAD(P)H-hydrate dehydratase/NAD(P)H-hydrate epimerase [Corynebacterium sp. UBA2622]|uniref:bifunctional ADP-dependent NAD(P)H-hydrate dehydratase/NAD(P)H-hydrate epimerase n=1 Tax=Corynebacterium sp. UBA2622 TaxID=1946393 RepID=UPI0025BBAF99|nr:bifunctional ADP-dependent NAD(P)H-hydrate dehydratase/NAD(P)H-hydrate epimerase [Corynebacterium sp. UBA2622]